jgi:leader peptidase (prepilin peptidase)/N-methyltransferase
VLTEIDNSSEPAWPAIDIRPDLRVLVVGCAAVALISAATLPLSVALASTVLGALMIAGADIDARTYLLPDFVTLGAFVCGVLVQFALDPFSPTEAAGLALARGAATAMVLALVRWGYTAKRGREGIGLGDVKLAAAIGAWLPVEAIPVCFLLATGTAFVTVLLARLRGESFDRTTRIPFGTFLCPSLWLTFFFCALVE